MSGTDGSLFELFREEVKAHADTLAAGLLAVEADADASRIEPLMRAAHSIKGAARIVGIDTAVRLAHVMEDALVEAQHGKTRLTATDIDALLKGADVLGGLANLTPEAVAAWEADNAAAVAALEPVFVAAARGERPNPPAPFSVREGGAGGTQGSPSRTEKGAGGLGSSHDLPPAPPFEPASIPAEPFALAPEHSMLDLFREEAREHLHAISEALPALAEDPTAAGPVVEALRQIRGGARLVKCAPVAAAVGSVGAFAAAARERKGGFSPEALNWMRFAVATLAGVLTTDDETFPQWAASATEPLAGIAEVFTRALAANTPAAAEELSANRDREGAGEALHPATGPSRATEQDVPAGTAESRAGSPARAAPVGDGAAVAPAPPAPSALPASPAPAETVVRVTARSLSRLMGLAGESLVQARWLPSFSTALLKLRKQHDLLARLLDETYHAAVGGAAGGAAGDRLAELVADARRQWAACRQELTDKTIDFDDHAARAEDLNARLYREVIASRMRPFGDGVHGLPRLVRDMARSLGKEARLVVAGEQTEVDRDILDKLESPLSHLVRNAVDHGLEAPEARAALGKPPAGTIAVEARHRAGMLQVTVADDGAGVDLARLRGKVVDRGLNTAEVVARMGDAELLEFLFLPGFSTTESVTEFSGRGVGLDVVQDTIRKVGGSVRVATTPGRGTAFHLRLPLTLSVIRAVVVDVGGEPYAFPHTRIDRLLRVPRDEVRSLEHRQFVNVDGQNVGLVMAGQLLDVPAHAPGGPALPVVLLSDAGGAYGLVVDSFRGEQDLVVRPLDPRLGKVPNLSAAAILDDGSPVLIVDVEDLIRSMDQFIQTGVLARCEARPAGPERKKRVLVVDDSITVREVERQLLLHRGFEVVVAVDGMDGWNKVRAGQYDLMVSDVDMPRMTGLQLVQAVRGDDRLRDLPVIIVSYKEREEDRLRGMEVGANAYLTKSSFHDNRFIEAVTDLIGEP